MRIVTYRPWYAAPRSNRSQQAGGYSPLDRLHEEMNRLFEESFGQLDQLSEELSEFSPSHEIDQDENRYTITLEVPGVKREDVSVETRDDMLVISGTKHRTAKSETNENVQSSRRYGRFSQALSLPDDADRDNITADFADGVLTVSIPRDREREQKRSRRIEVQQGESSDGGESGTERLTRQDEHGQGQGGREQGQDKSEQSQSRSERSQR